MKTVTLYTDGACSGNPGIGGYAGILIYGDVKREYSGAEAQTTNNRMEVMAVIVGFVIISIIQPIYQSYQTIGAGS